MYGSFASVEEFNLGLIPFDSDLLSMEVEEAYRVSWLPFTYFYITDSLNSVGKLGVFKYANLVVDEDVKKPTKQTKIKYAISNVKKINRTSIFVLRIIGTAVDGPDS